jgi:hypothetical protein
LVSWVGSPHTIVDLLPSLCSTFIKNGNGLFIFKCFISLTYSFIVSYIHFSRTMKWLMWEMQSSSSRRQILVGV